VPKSTTSPGDEAAIPSRSSGAAKRQESPGLDEAKHVRAQQTAHRAELLRSGRVFAAQMVEPLAGGAFDTDSYHAYIDGILQDLGKPSDPLIRILVEQLAFAHLRLAGLHGSASSAKSTDAVKVYNAACARLMAEVRRSVLTIDSMRGKSPAIPKLKIAKTG